MNIVSKILAGVYFYHFSRGAGKEISGIGLFMAKLMLALPFALFGVLIAGSLMGGMGQTGAQVLPSSKVTSFLFLLFFLPLIHYLSAGKEDLFLFIKQTDELTLRKYNRYYNFILITSAVFFIILVLLFKGSGMDEG